jgi:hypothetical protein
MRRARERGVALLAVTLVLLVIGALALAMSREGAMAAHTVDSDYDTAAARSLADGALALAKWRNERGGCKTRTNLALTPVGNAGSVSATVTGASSNRLDIVAVGTTPTGARVTVERDKVVTHDPTKTVTRVANTSGATSTWLDSTRPNIAMSISGFIEVGGASTSDRSRALLRFALGDIPSDASILSAQLTLTRYAGSSQAASVAVHRVARSWTELLATWNTAALLTGWTNAGGDYSAGSAVSHPVGAKLDYTWDVTALVDGWIGGLYPNYGFLLEADGVPQRTRYYDFSGLSGNRPTLTITYSPAC